MSKMSKMKLSMKGTLATVLCMGLFLNLLSANVFASPLPESNTSEAVVSEVNQETAPLTIAEEPSQPALENTEVAGTASEESGGATQPGGSSSEQNTAESSTTESSLNESSAESSADGLSSSAAAAKAPLLGVPSPLGVICAGLDSLPKDGDTILYGIVNDTAQTFNVNVPKDLFGNGDITMTVSLAGVYGMAFTDNLASDLKEKAQIRDAFYTADANGNNTTLTVVIDGTLTDNYLMALGTKYVVLNNGQCADIIANDYTDATVTFTIKNENGDVISSNSSYVLRPETYTNSDVRIDEHKWTIGTDSAYLNWNTLSDGNPLYNHELLATDAFKMTVPVVSVDGNCLMQLGQIKVYAPGDEFILKSIQRGGQYSGWGPLTGPSLSGDYYFLEYFKSSDNYTAHDDNDGKGAYYLFEPRRPLYNNGTSTLTSSVSYYAYFNWNVKPGIDYLEGNHTYAAENEIINYTAEGDTAGTVDSNPGMIYTTMPIVKRDSVVFYPNNDYQKYTDKTGVETTKEKYVPGASYTGKRFNIVGNRGGYGTATVDGQSQTVEFQTVKGKTAETYNFPYEVQPTAINFSQSWERSIVDSVSYTITKANGSTQTFTASLNKYCAEIGSLSFSDALASAGEDARVSNVVVNWSQIKGNGAYATFDYLVTKTHKDGSAFQGGDLLQVGYNAVCSDDGKTFDTAANQTRYFYLSLGGQKCPWLVANGSSYQRYRAQDLDNDELSLCSALFLKGLSGGSYRNYLENPVIKLDAALASVYGMDDPTCMLSGNMVMTKNMSGWKFTYSIGNISGCHINPAVSLAMLMNGKMTVKDFIGYAAAQFAGGICGAAILGYLAGWDCGFGANGLYQGDVLKSLIVEMILTFVFVLAVLGATAKMENSRVAGLVIGLSLTLVHIFGIHFTGTSVNPARSFGPALFAGGEALSNVWVFLVAPLMGGVVAALVWKACSDQNN